MYLVEKPLAGSYQVSPSWFSLILVFQVCLYNSPVFFNSSGRFCFAQNPIGNSYSKLSCANLPNITTPRPTPTPTPTPTTTPTGECRSEACTRLSKLLQSTMNTSVDPCDDFYRFSCGAAKKSTTQQMEEMIEERLEVWNVNCWPVVLLTVNLRWC